MSKDRVIETARKIICGEIGVVEGSRILSALRVEVTEADHDPDFIPFIGIDSESDHIPLGSVRAHFSATGLERMDAELKAIEDHYRQLAIEASQRLLERYAAIHT
jgi:hypothetical protein